MAALGGCSRGSDPATSDTDGGVFHIPDAARRPDAAPECIVRCGRSAECCGVGEECVADRCVPACAGNRCGDNDALCCTGDQLCVGGACVPRGRSCASGEPCGDHQTCDPVVHTCVPVPETAVCRFVPPAGSFEPVLQWAWDDESVVSSPLVVQLTDDDGNGRIDAHDVPDVVAITQTDTPRDGAIRSHLTALSGDDGHMLWQSADNDFGLCQDGMPAAADIDGDGKIEIVAVSGDYSDIGDGPAYPCGAFGHKSLVAYENDGALKWRSTVSFDHNLAKDAPSIADVDGDGHPEILTGVGVFDASGAQIWSTRAITVTSPFAADLDADGQQEYIASNRVYPGMGGSPLWVDDVHQGFAAVANVIGDAKPEIVISRSSRFSVVEAGTFRTVVGPFDLEEVIGGYPEGAPTIGDFDGDGEPEVGVNTAHDYVVFDFGDGLPSNDYISWRLHYDTTVTTSSTLFDFDGDGAVEVVLTDGCFLQIRKGMDGTLIWSTENTGGWRTMPIVADADGDGNAEIVVGGESSSESVLAACRLRREGTFRATAPTTGIRVFRDRLDHWVPTRPIWNQMAYSIDNVRDDGSIPAHPVRWWETHNSFRVNRLIDRDAVTYAPNLQVVNLSADTTGCSLRIVLRARVRNGGAWGVPAGLAVSFFDATGDRLLGVGHTTEELLGGDSTWVELAVDAPARRSDDTLDVYAIADDNGHGTGEHSECHEDDNRSATTTFVCADPI